MNGEYYYSIVAAYIYNGNLKYYRLADYDLVTKKIVEAHYNTVENQYIYEPVSFYARVFGDKYNAFIKKWKYDPVDEKRQYLQNSDLRGQVYEIVFLEDNIENNEFDEVRVRDILGKGFKIAQSVNNQFLLVVGYADNSLVTLLCNKNNFKKKTLNDEQKTEWFYIDRTDNNLEHSMKSFELYKINEDSIVSINNLLDHPFSKTIDIVERYFYNQLELPTKSSIFLTRQIEDYSLSFFSKYFKDIKETFSITNREKTKFLEILESVTNTKKYLNQFEDKTGYKSEEMYNIFVNISQDVIDVLCNKDQMGEMLISALLSNDDYYMKYLEKVQQEWEASDDFINLKNKREKLLDELISCIDEVKLDLEQSKLELENVRQQHDVLLKENKCLNDKNKEINEEINKSLHDYRNSLVSLIKETVPLDFIKSDTCKKNEKKGFIHVKNKELGAEQSENLDYLDIFDFFIDNLSMCYVVEKSVEISAAILTSIANYKAIIVDESLGEIVANSLSMVIDGKRVEKYSIYSIDVDVQHLLHSITKNKNRIIYIDGVLNSFNETLFKLLVKGFPSKVFIFGVDEENIKTLSKGIWKFANYIEINNGYKGYKKEEPILSIYEIKNLRNELRNLEGSIKDTKLQKLTLFKDSQLVNNTLQLKIYSSLVNCTELPAFYINQLILNATIPLEKLIGTLVSNYSKELLEKSLLSDELESEDYEETVNN